MLVVLYLVVSIKYIRRFCDYINVLHIFDQTRIVLKSGWSSTSTTAQMPASSLIFPCLRLPPRRTGAAVHTLFFTRYMFLLPSGRFFACLA